MSVDENEGRHGISRSVGEVKFRQVVLWLRQNAKQLSTKKGLSQDSDKFCPKISRGGGVESESLYCKLSRTT